MGDICTCDESSGAKWPVLRHGVQHVDSVVPRRDGRRFYGAGPGLFRGRNVCIHCSVHTRFSSGNLYDTDHGPVHFHALRYHDFCAEVGIRSFGGHLLNVVRGIVHVAHAYNQSLAWTVLQLSC